MVSACSLRERPPNVAFQFTVTFAFTIVVELGKFDPPFQTTDGVEVAPGGLAYVTQILPGLPLL